QTHSRAPRRETALHSRTAARPRHDPPWVPTPSSVRRHPLSVALGLDEDPTVDEGDGVFVTRTVEPVLHGFPQVAPALDVSRSPCDLQHLVHRHSGFYATPNRGEAIEVAHRGQTRWYSTLPEWR